MSMQVRRMKIYQVTNNVTDDVYIGTTSQALYKRLYRHKCDMESGVESKLCNLMRQLGKDKFKIELVEEFDFTSTEASHAKELSYVRERGPSLNGCLPKTDASTSSPVHNLTDIQHDEYKTSIDALQQKVELLERRIESLMMQHSRPCSSLTTPMTPSSFNISDGENEDVKTEVAEDVPMYDLRDDRFHILDGKVDKNWIAEMQTRYNKIQRIALHLKQHPRDTDSKEELLFERTVFARRIARIRGDAKYIGLEQRCLKLLDTIEKETGICKKLKNKATWRALSFRKNNSYEDDD